MLEAEGGEHRGGVNSRPAQIRSAIEGSLKRLNTDYIDLFQLHGFDALTPVEEVLGTLARLVDAGWDAIAALPWLFIHIALRTETPETNP